MVEQSVLKALWPALKLLFFDGLITEAESLAFFLPADAETVTTLNWRMAEGAANDIVAAPSARGTAISGQE